jgi:hypothetical protein
LISYLEVVSQQLLDNLQYNSNYIRIVNTDVRSDLKVFRGSVVELDHFHNTQAIIGNIDYNNGHTTFTPLVPFDIATAYTAVYDNTFYPFEIAQAESYETLSISEIYPSVRQVPANILKWYIQFSRAVNPVRIYEYIEFLDEYGNAIDRSILHLGAPLLSEDGTLLTVWIEPGRQKQLLGPNQHLGSVFKPHKTYTLRIAATIKDAQGIPIDSAFLHTFTTIASDRIMPSLSGWKVQSIKSGQKKPLKIICDEQLDYGSLIDAFSIIQDNKEVKGTLTYDSEINTICFTPSDNWKKGTYTISLGHQLEDLAGNNLIRLFDRPIHQNKSNITPPKLTIKAVCN